MKKLHLCILHLTFYLFLYSGNLDLNEVEEHIAGLSCLGDDKQD